MKSLDHFWNHIPTNYPQGCFLFIRMILDFTKPPASNFFFRKAEGDLRKPGAHLVAEFGSDRNEYSNLDPQIIARIQSPNAAVGRLVGWLVFLKVRKGGSNFSGHGKKMKPKSQEDSLSLKKTSIYV